jgi:serine/threonine protein phosphatase PrpC
MYKNFEFSHIGSKKIQEDNKLIFKYNNIYFYFIFDGHGYKKNEISLVHYLLSNNFLKNKLILFFKNNILNSENIKLFFINLDKELLSKNINSGVCLAGIIYDTDKIYILNIGDTVVYIFNKDKKNIFKNALHNVQNETELSRIKKFNKLKYVKNDRYKKLSITRSLGDKDCKDLVNEPLIACPDVYILNNNVLYYFLISTDGINMEYDIKKIINLYDFYNNKQLYNYCKTISQNNLKQYNMVDNILFYILTNQKNLIINKILYNSLRFNL